LAFDVYLILLIYEIVHFSIAMIILHTYVRNRFIDTVSRFIYTYFIFAAIFILYLLFLAFCLIIIANTIFTTIEILIMKIYFSTRFMFSIVLYLQKKGRKYLDLCFITSFIRQEFIKVGIIKFRIKCISIFTI
jgi:hypothetical protein